MTGVFSGQGRLFSMLAYVVANAAAVLWTWVGDPQVSLLWEVAAAAVIFLLVPDKLLRRLGTLVRQEGPGKRTPVPGPIPPAACGRPPEPFGRWRTA